jgi:hypothetical protein
MASERQSDPPHSIPPVDIGDYDAPAGSQQRSHSGDGRDQAARSQAADLWDETRQKTRSALGEQKQAAASGIGDLAGALRNAARDVDDNQQEMLGRVVHSAADGLDRLSSTLRNKDVGTLVQDVESFARRQPAVFFGVAIAAGFLAVRFLKSESSSPSFDRPQHDRRVNTAPLPSWQVERRQIH